MIKRVLKHGHVYFLGRKQSEKNEDFAWVADNITNLISRDHIKQITEKAVDEISRSCKGKKAAVSWSGGKDSICLLSLANIAGIKDSMFAMCNVEYPAFLQWVTDHMPENVTVINTGLDLEWVKQDEKRLFPQDPRYNNQWFKEIQHKAQAQYFKDHELDVMLLGRRIQDGNYVGDRSTGWYENRDGTVRFSPIRFWSHAEIMAYNFYNGHVPPPTYGWPNGFVTGTCPWPGRLFTKNVEDGWCQTWQIDPSLVRLGANHFESARLWLAAHGHS